MGGPSVGGGPGARAPWAPLKSGPVLAYLLPNWAIKCSSVTLSVIVIDNGYRPLISTWRSLRLQMSYAEFVNFNFRIFNSIIIIKRTYYNNGIESKDC